MSGFFKVNIRFPCSTFRILLQLEALVLFTKLIGWPHSGTFSQCKETGSVEKSSRHNPYDAGNYSTIFQKFSRPRVQSSVICHEGQKYIIQQSGVTSRKGKIVTPLVLVVVQSLSHIWLFVTPWTAAHQAALSSTISPSLFRFISIESRILSNHLNLCQLLLLPSVFPSIRVFSNEPALHIRWPEYWSFSFSICPSNEYSGLISLRID